ncbi:MAG TPA: hypothetical protein VI462_15435 [Acidimicrobiia bacterium]
MTRSAGVRPCLFTGEMAAFLASDTASFRTGAWFGVDGRYTAR